MISPLFILHSTHNVHFYSTHSVYSTFDSVFSLHSPHIHSSLFILCSFLNLLINCTKFTPLSTLYSHHGYYYFHFHYYHCCPHLSRFLFRGDLDFWRLTLMTASGTILTSMASRGKFALTYRFCSFYNRLLDLLCDYHKSVWLLLLVKISLRYWND